ncbi:MAG: hypothetical protein IKH95_05015 [Bacteroidaceae bacterium]|nr:hypothetical protein [Bacteroidaceae bacterium]
MKSLKIALYLSLLLFFASCVKDELPYVDPEIEDDGTGFSSIWGVFRDVNHRGYCTIAPENTFPAFALSKEKGFKIIEVDLRYSQDGVPVLIHDATVNRTSNGEGDVDKLTYEQLRTLDFGFWKSELYAGTQIPSLEEFFSFCKENDMKMYLELKSRIDHGKAEEIVRLLSKYGLSQSCTFISFSSAYLKEIAKVDGNFRFGVLDSSGLESLKNKVSDLNSVVDLSNIFADISYTQVDESLISYCKKTEIPLEVWTVDRKDYIKKMDAYISGVTSNSLKASDYVTL